MRCRKKPTANTRKRNTMQHAYNTKLWSSLQFYCIAVEMPRWKINNFFSLQIYSHLRPIVKHTCVSVWFFPRRTNKMERKGWNEKLTIKEWNAVFFSSTWSIINEPRFLFRKDSFRCRLLLRSNSITLCIRITCFNNAWTGRHTQSHSEMYCSQCVHKCIGFFRIQRCF